MSDNIYARIILKQTNNSGKVPTIPTSNDYISGHTSGTWLDTDIYGSEIYVNTFDKKIWYRANNSIVELANTSMLFTRIQADLIYLNSGQSYLSANTSFYTQAQANANFLSANTSYYTQSQANANFISASTIVLSRTIADTIYLNSGQSYLSANTSYYTQAQANSNFLSSTTSYYTQAQANGNFLSANTVLSSNTITGTTTGTTYTLQASDANKMLIFNSAATGVYTVPLNIFPVYTQIIFNQANTGQLTITGATSVTINSADNLYKLRTKYSIASLFCTSDNVWNLYGDLT